MNPDANPVRRVTRLARIEDTSDLVDLERANRGFLRPWEPTRDDEYYTVVAYRTSLAQQLERHAAGFALPLVIIDEDGAVAGRISLHSIVRGALQSATLGYWLAESATGRGLASTALGELIDISFAELGLHRLEAGTMVSNMRSRRVLERHGFEQYGVAPRFLRINGVWEDHMLFQLVNDAWTNASS